MRWFVNTAVTSGLILLHISSVWAGPAENAANAAASVHAGTLNTQTPGAAAGLQNYYDNVQPNYGTGAALNESALKPLTQGSQLRNVTGNTVLGNVSIMQSSGTPLLRVTTIPNLATGDLAAIAIEQDLNASGTIDYTASIGGGGTMISGACSNGVILCQPGTFSNCSYERWDTDANGGLTISSRIGVPTTQTDLFNCYCFNNYCSRFNNSGALNLANIEQEMAGNLLAKFMEKRPDLLVSSVAAGDSVVSYFGTKTSSASQVPGYTAPRIPNTDYSRLPAITANTPDITLNYYSDPGSLDAASATENQAMAQIPNSLYSIVNNMQNNQGSQISRCTNLRTIGLSARTVTNSGSVTNTICSDHNVYFRIKTDDTKTFVTEFVGTSPGDPPTSPGGRCPGIWGAAFSVGTVSPPSAPDILDTATSQTGYMCNYTYAGSSGSGTGQWFPTYPTVMPWSLASLTMVWPAAQTFDVTCTMSADYTVESIVENTTNGCSSFETDAACRLQTEMWDGRPYVSNFLNTGFQMSQICNDYPGTIRNYRICRPWMKQDRTYVCDRNSANNFDNFLQTLRPQVKATQDASIVPTVTGSAAVTCEISCKTKILRSDTQMRAGGVESDVKQTASVAQNAFDFFVKQCSVTNGANVCPVDTTKGESIVTDCGCINEFGYALAQVDAINKAANDTICSDTPAN